MNRFKEFFDSDIDYLLIIGERGSGRSSLVDEIKEAYFARFPDTKKYEKSYVNIYQFKAAIYYEETLSDLGNYNMHDYSSRDGWVMPLVFIDQLDDMNDYEKHMFNKYVRYSNHNSDMRFKLIITATKETVNELGLDKPKHMTLLLEDNHIDLDKENEKALERLYSYQGIKREDIDFINAAIMFGDGIISEYSFINAFKDKLGLSSYRPQEILEFLRKNKDIYYYQENEDVEVYNRFIWFRHHTFYLYLKEKLKDNIQLVANTYFDLYKDIHFEQGEYKNYFETKLRLKALFNQGAFTLFDYLFTQEDDYYCLFSNPIGSATFDEVLLEELSKNESLKDKIDEVFNIAFEREWLINKALHLVLDAFIPTYMMMDRYDLIDRLVEKTFLTIYNNKKYQENNDKEYIKKVIAINEMYYLSHPEKEIRRYHINTIMNAMPIDDGSDEFYKETLELTVYLVNIKAEEAKVIVDKYFTFETSKDLIYFAIESLNGVAMVEMLQKVAVIKTK